MNKYLVKVSCGSKTFGFQTDSALSMLCYLSDHIDRDFIKNFLENNNSNE